MYIRIVVRLNQLHRSELVIMQRLELTEEPFVMLNITLKYNTDNIKMRKYIYDFIRNIHNIKALIMEIVLYRVLCDAYVAAKILLSFRKRLFFLLI
jgi:hypothetical protein